MNLALWIAWAELYMKTCEIKLAFSTFSSTPHCCSRALSWNIICISILPSSAIAMLQEYFLPWSSYILSHLSSVALNAGFFTVMKGSIWPTKKFVTELFNVLYSKLPMLHLEHLENDPEKVASFSLLKPLSDSEMGDGVSWGKMSGWLF